MYYSETKNTLLKIYMCLCIYNGNTPQSCQWTNHCSPHLAEKKYGRPPKEQSRRKSHPCLRPTSSCPWQRTSGGPHHGPPQQWLAWGWSRSPPAADGWLAMYVMKDLHLIKNTAATTSTSSTTSDYPFYSIDCEWVTSLGFTKWMKMVTLYLHLL